MDLLDRRIVHALRQAGTVRVVGSLSAERRSLTTWMIRLQCAPGSSEAIAKAQPVSTALSAEQIAALTPATGIWLAVEQA